MSKELIDQAIAKGAKIYGSISGGKDGDAMVMTLVKNRYAITALIHADLGRTEWQESMDQCKKMAWVTGLPLLIATRTDGRDMLDHWEARLQALQGTGKPFWPSSAARYCTSDLKRDPIDKLLRSRGDNFIISCEGIRAEESTTRAAKEPLAIRTRLTSDYYTIKKQYTQTVKRGKKTKKVKAMKIVRWMTVEEAIANFNPEHRLALTWYPIFNMTLEEVWGTRQQTSATLQQARKEYQQTGTVPFWWPFHPAYVYGNDRVSCVFCVLGSRNDLEVGAKHNPWLLDIMIDMEERGQATFKNNFSLKQLKQ